MSLPADRRARSYGYATGEERWQKQWRLQVLTARPVDVEAQSATGVLGVCRGGRRLARNRHNLETAGQGVDEWSAEWKAARWFITAGRGSPGAAARARPSSAPHGVRSGGCRGRCGFGLLVAGDLEAGRWAGRQQVGPPVPEDLCWAAGPGRHFEP